MGTVCFADKGMQQLSRCKWFDVSFMTHARRLLFYPHAPNEIAAFVRINLIV